MVPVFFRTHCLLYFTFLKFVITSFVFNRSARPVTDLGIYIITSGTDCAMRYNPPWKAESHSSGDEAFCVLLQWTVYFRGYRSQPLIPIQSQFNPVHTLKRYCFKIHFNSIPHLYLDFSNGHFPSGLPIEIFYAYPIYYVCDTQLTHPNCIVLNFITQIIFR